MALLHRRPDRGLTRPWTDRTGAWVQAEDRQGDQRQHTRRQKGHHHGEQRSEPVDDRPVPPPGQHFARPDHTGATGAFWIDDGKSLSRQFKEILQRRLSRNRDGSTASPAGQHGGHHHRNRCCDSEKRRRSRHRSKQSRTPNARAKFPGRVYAHFDGRFFSQDSTIVGERRDRPDGARTRGFRCGPPARPPSSPERSRTTSSRNRMKTADRFSDIHPAWQNRSPGSLAEPQVGAVVGALRSPGPECEYGGGDRDQDADREFPESADHPSGISTCSHHHPPLQPWGTVGSGR